MLNSQSFTSLISTLIFFAIFVIVMDGHSRKVNYTFRIERPVEWEMFTNKSMEKKIVNRI